MNPWLNHFDTLVTRPVRPSPLVNHEKYFNESMEELNKPHLLGYLEPKAQVRTARVWWKGRGADYA